MQNKLYISKVGLVNRNCIGQGKSDRRIFD